MIQKQFTRGLSEKAMEVHKLWGMQNFKQNKSFLRAARGRMPRRYTAFLEITNFKPKVLSALRAIEKIWRNGWFVTKSPPSNNEITFVREGRRSLFCFFAPSERKQNYFCARSARKLVYLIARSREKTFYLIVWIMEKVLSALRATPRRSPTFWKWKIERQETFLCATPRMKSFKNNWKITKTSGYPYPPK